MPTHYSPPFPTWLWIAAAIVAAGAQWWFWKRTALRGWARAVVCAVRLAVIVLASWLLLNPMTPWHGKQQPARSLLLLDASASMDFQGSDGLTRTAQARAVQDAVLADPQIADRVQVVWFDGQTHASSPPAKSDASRSTTRLGGALRESLAASSGPQPLAAAVIVSDGAAQDTPAVQSMTKVAAARRMPLAVMPVGAAHPVTNAAIAACLVERRAAPGTTLPVTITVQRLNCQEHPLAVSLIDRKTQKVIETTTLSSRPGGAEMETVELHITTGAEPMQVLAKIDTLPGEATAADNETTFTIESSERKLCVLFMEGTYELNGMGRNAITMLPDGVRQEDANIEVDALTLNLPNARGGSVLMRARWTDPADVVKSREGFPATKEELFRYDLVICSDIPQVAFTKEQIDWVVELVAERGGGFAMIGGYTSFGTGQWDRTPWEKLIPFDMTYAGAGYLNEYMEVVWPKEARDHPILAALPRKGETLKDILDAHPQLGGTNIIRRAKPAAVTLMRRDEEAGQPLLAVQNFGKGRTLAFTSDITQGWGVYHESMWGPQSQAQNSRANFSGLLREDVQTTGGTGPMPESNAYFRRFWTSAIHWLTEKSVAQNASRFYAGCAALTWADDQPLSVYAVAADPVLAARIGTWRAAAWVKDAPSARALLRWQPEGQRFTGLLARPESLPEGENAIVVEAVSPDQKDKVRAEFTVRVMPYDPERTDPQPRPQLLEDIAAATGAPVLQRSAAVVEWLRSIQSTADQKALTASVPAWDRWPVLVLILALLGLEWIVRRLYS